MIVRLNRLLVQQADASVAVRPQLPITLGEDSEPEPDFALVPNAPAGADEHPTQALLVIEVARDSLRRDRSRKAALYARSNIPEYWIVDVDGRSIEVVRDPDADARCYRNASRFGAGAVIVSAAVPQVQVELDALFGEPHES